MKEEACELCSSEAAAGKAGVALDVMAEESDSSTPLDTTDDKAADPDVPWISP